MTARLAASLAVVAFAASCGGKSICSNNVDLASKAGDCSGVAAGPVLGMASTCGSRAMACSADEQRSISTALDCLSQLPTCSAASQADWRSQQQGCVGSLASLSAGCRDMVFSGGVPGGDAGSDAGSEDAGRQPIEDGGHGISFVAVADESNFAFAWEPLQPAGINRWELNSFEVSDGGPRRLAEVPISGGATRVFEQNGVGAGVSRKFFMVGLDLAGQVVFGLAADAGSGADAGPMCTRHDQCSTTQVCDLGMCVTQTCAMTATCPQPDYICNVNVTPRVCLRTGGGNMGIDAGTGVSFAGRLPMISQSQTVQTGAAQFSERFVGGFPGRRPDMVAIDSARQFVAMEQGGVPVGHFTVSRGANFVSDQLSAAAIDTVGTGVRVTYNPDSQVIYACYSVGRGVRVRRSRDFGKTWGTDALTLAPDDDAGTGSSIRDCDIAPWKNGTALLVTIDDDTVVTRQINEGLVVNGTPDPAFVSGPTDGGGYNVFNPRHVTLATLPAADLVHIGFTATRYVSGIQDSDIFGVYRDSSSGGVFSNPLFINHPGNMNGSTFAQDYVSLAIDPVTRRGVAAWTSLENTGGGSYSTVYLGFFNNTTKAWITGSDLSVFMQFSGNYPLFPSRTTGLWDAFGAQLATLRDGRVWLFSLVGERKGTNEIFPYAVEFAFDAGSPVGMGAVGWFKPPATKMSSTKAVDPRAGGNSVPATNAAFAADSQISIYGTFIEAVGPLNSDENRGVFVTRP